MELNFLLWELYHRKKLELPAAHHGHICCRILLAFAVTDELLLPWGLSTLPRLHPCDWLHEGRVPCPAVNFHG